ncbi:hypothetical protein [Paenibacillus eucommiae]|nr:hypothetical protein [Paenibacillus eucommiae]
MLQLWPAPGTPAAAGLPDPPDQERAAAVFLANRHPTYDSPELSGQQP